jgi:hypothetical protein
LRAIKKGAEAPFPEMPKCYRRYLPAISSSFLARMIPIQPSAFQTFTIDHAYQLAVIHHRSVGLDVVFGIDLALIPSNDFATGLPNAPDGE